MSETFVLMLVLALVIAIVMSFGPQGIGYLVLLVKSKLTQLRKTKTDHTA